MFFLAKLEGNNPAGSVKDRAAVSMILGAQNKGLVKKFFAYRSYEWKYWNRSCYGISNFGLSYEANNA